MLGDQCVGTVRSSPSFRSAVSRIRIWYHLQLCVTPLGPNRRFMFSGLKKPSRKQLVHILEVEETWVLDLQDQSCTHWREEDCADLRALLANKARVQSATQDYLHGLSDMELNRRLTERPQQWVGELRSPAFIILHIVTHAFHHKGQVVAMLRTLGYPAPDTDLQRA
ncbi:MAG: hypothetical protein DMG34_17765 [Acidobacteria bacterium]|nr:MAG: hypothetical protein DMG34_17765 [Acidobacteriota bacterium]